MNKIKLLLVEDEPTLAMIIKDTLDAEGFVVTTARDGVEGLEAFQRERPDVVVADVMMPRMDGFEMVRRLRRSDKATPVLFLTARSEVSDVVEGFEMGGNDYLRKPFGMQELIVRVRALVGRSGVRDTADGTPADEVRAIGRYRLDTVRQTLTIDGHSVELSYRETQLLRMLAEKEGDVVEMRAILLSLWGDDSIFNTRSLHVFITKLRHYLADDPAVRIVNVRGIGYRLIQNS